MKFFYRLLEFLFRTRHESRPQRSLGLWRSPDTKQSLVSSFVFGIFLPNHCLSCESIINKNQDFCDDCSTELRPIKDPKCKICSYPFEIEIKGMQPLCSKCLRKKPSYEKSIALFHFDHVIKKVIGDFKYRDQIFLAKKLAKIFLQKAEKEISDADLIIAVPLHLKKLRKRKFNQAVLIGKFLTKTTLGKKFYPDFLLKIKETKSQTELSQKAREKNLKRAFLVNKKYRELLRGKKILLIDDVTTTGATLENCAKELKRRGAKEVTVMTIAKTVLR